MMETTLNQTSETVIISREIEIIKGTFVNGVFDSISYLFMTLGFIILFGFIWIALQIEQYQRLTLRAPTLFEESVHFANGEPSLFLLQNFLPHKI